MITNRILRGILNTFESSFGLSKDESKSFERFASYVILSKIDPDVFSDPGVFDLIDVDRSGTFGVDVAAVFVNETLVTTPEDIAAQRRAKRLDVRFVFLQAKASSSIDCGSILKFAKSVENLFSPNPSIPISDDLSNARQLIDEVFSPENARLFGPRRPTCELYFVTAGQSTSDENVNGVIRDAEASIRRGVSELSAVSARHIDADTLIDAFNEVENRFQVRLTLHHAIPCAEIEGVIQAYIGYVPAQEFLRLIEASDGTLRRHVFYENVRDFQGADNSVNSEISETLSDPLMQDKFVLLNNGVTVIASDFRNLRSSDYEISDYFIVNGCQTSHVIYSHRQSLRDNNLLKVPVKIIHTKSNDLIAKIIRSTNRQTPVPDEAFASLERFHKRLQDYYRAFPDDARHRLFYERRSKEFTGSDEVVERPRIVNLHSQIRSFASVILGEPQTVMSRNPSTILRDHGGRMFLDGHRYAPYLLGSFLVFRFQTLMSMGQVDGRLAHAKYWIAWIARVAALARIEVGPLDSQKVDKDCEALVLRLIDDAFAFQLFDAAAETFRICRSDFLRENNAKLKELIRLRQFRDHVRSYLAAEISRNSPPQA